MGRIVRAWLIAAAVWGVGLLVIAKLASHLSTRDLFGYDQTLSIHLPWLLTSFLMTLLSGLEYPDREATERRALAMSLIPVLATVGGVLTGMFGQTSAVAVTAYVIEGFAGLGIGLFFVLVLADGNRERFDR